MEDGEKEAYRAIPKLKENKRLGGQRNEKMFSSYRTDGLGYAERKKYA